MVIRKKDKIFVLNIRKFFVLFNKKIMFILFLLIILFQQNFPFSSFVSVCQRKNFVRFFLLHFSVVSKINLNKNAIRWKRFLLILLEIFVLFFFFFAQRFYEPLICRVRVSNQAPPFSSIYIGWCIWFCHGWFRFSLWPNALPGSNLHFYSRPVVIA